MGSTGRIGGQSYDAQHILSYLWRLMKRFPDLKAQEILWSFFIPNDEALREAQEDGSPSTLSNTIENLLRYEDHEKIEEDTEPSGKYGFYLLSVTNVKEHGHHRPHHIVAVAKGANQARNIAAREARRFEHPVSYGTDALWKNKRQSYVSLMFPFEPADTTRSRFRPRIVCASDPLNYTLASLVEKTMRKKIKAELQKELGVKEE